MPLLQPVPAAIIACAYDSSHCSASGLALVPGETLTGGLIANLTSDGNGGLIAN